MCSTVQKILVVDDEPEICWAIETIVKRVGCEPVTAFLARTALELVQSTEFQLAFVDAKLPDMDGIELVRRLTELQAGLPVVLISAYISLDDRRVQRLMDAGAISAFVPKPYMNEQIRQLIHKLAIRLKP